MSPSTRTIACIAAAASALLLASGAIAEVRPAPPASANATHHGMDRTDWHEARVQRWAGLLHDLLEIRQDQEPAFKTFVADMRVSRQERAARAEALTPPSQPLTTPERLDRMGAWMAKRSAERQAAFQRRADAIRRFYAILSPAQQKAFDALHALHAGGGMMHHGLHGPDGHDGGPPAGGGAAG